MFLLGFVYVSFRFRYFTRFGDFTPTGTVLGPSCACRSIYNNIIWYVSGHNIIWYVS